MIRAWLLLLGLLAYMVLPPAPLPAAAPLPGQAAGPVVISPAHLPPEPGLYASPCPKVDRLRACLTSVPITRA